MKRFLLFLYLILALSLPSTAANPFDQVVARVGRGLPPAAGVLISREGLLVTTASAVNPKGPTRVVLGGAELSGIPVSVPDLPELALLAVSKPDGGEFQTVALGVASLLAPGGRVVVHSGDSVSSVETTVRDIERDPRNGAHYLRLELPHAPGLAGAPVCLPEDGRLVALIVADSKAQTGCRALTVESLKEALFDAGRTVRPLLAPAAMQSGGLEQGRIRSWAFPLRSQGDAQSVELVRSMQQWRTISGFQLPPLSPLRDLGNGAVCFATQTGGLYAVAPGSESLLWRYGANDMAVLHPPAVSEGRVFLATGELGLQTWKRENTGGAVDFMIDVFGMRYDTSLIVNRGAIHALDARTGEFKWLYETRMVGEPQVVGPLVCFGGLGVYGALDSRTGQVRWLRGDQSNRREANWYCLKAGRDGVLYGLVVPVRVEGHGTPDEPIALVGDGEVRAIALDAVTGTPRWSTRLTRTEHPTALPMATSVLVDHDASIYAAFGQEVFVLDPAGAVRNKFALRSATFSDRMALSHGVLFVAADNGLLYALRGSDGAVAWSFPKPMTPVGSPVVFDGVVYVGSQDGELYALDEKTGHLAWQVKLDRRISARPLVSSGTLFCASEEGRIWSILLPPR